MKICLVTTFPPSRGGLSEYGFHIASELQRNPFLSLTVLADSLDGKGPDPDGFAVDRCWSFNDPNSSTRLLRAIHRHKPDVVWFNLLFTTFGHNPLVAFCGLATPLLTRLLGRYTHVTLHQLMDAVDMKDAGVRFPRLYRAAGGFATRMLLMSNSVTVLMPAYRKILVEQYGRQNVHVRAHGILSYLPEYPDFSRRGNPHRVLAFGKWGTYKRLEPMIEAFELISKSLPNVKLVVGGGDHPRMPGYVASVAKRFENDSRLEFTGYVAEEQIPELFRTASVAVMPYSSSTGASGVAHLACAFGVPIISADITDFRQMADEEGLAIDFYQPSNTQDLAKHVISLLQSPEQQEEMVAQNFSAALRMTMPQIIHEYIRHFGVERHTKALKSMTRLRRLPRWMPVGLFAGRLRGQNHLRWSDRSTFGYMPGARKSRALLHDDGRRSGSLDTSRYRVDGNDVGLSGSGNGVHGVGLPTSTARTEKDGHPQHNAGQSNPPDALHLDLEQRKAGDAQDKPAGVKRAGPLPVSRPAKPAQSPASRYRKDGTSGS
jgi:glycosyltransferase involved in cell wall biosynthesis